jgi:hypothetical protein
MMMQNYNSENYNLYVTSTDDKNGMQKAHFFDLLEVMMQPAPASSGVHQVAAWLRDQPSSYFACESVSKSTVMATIRKVAAELGVKG